MPLENHKAIGLLRNTGLDPLENRKMPDLIWIRTVQYFDGIPELFKVYINFKVSSRLNS